MSNLKLKSMLLAVALLGATVTVFADGAAPVYDADADSYPPQFDGQPDSEGPVAAEPKTPADLSSSMTLSQRIARLEQQGKGGNSVPTARVDSLQADVQALRGQVEELTHQLQQFQSQQRVMNADLDKRLTQQSIPAKPILAAALPKATIKSPSISAKSQPIKGADASNSQPNVAEEQQIYQTAYNYIKAKKYNEAVTALKGMLQKYPSGQFAANAHYWLGELYGLMNNNDQSLSEFVTVVNNYPDSPKVSDAELKLGMIYAGQFKWPQAKTTFKKIVSKFPGTTSARMASEQLTQIKLAGH